MIIFIEFNPYLLILQSLLNYLKKNFKEYKEFLLDHNYEELMAETEGLLVLECPSNLKQTADQLKRFLHEIAAFCHIEYHEKKSIGFEFNPNHCLNQVQALFAPDEFFNDLEQEKCQLENILNGISACIYFLDLQLRFKAFICEQEIKIKKKSLDSC